MLTLFRQSAVLYVTSVSFPLQDDWEKVQKPTDTYISTVDSSTSSWASWLIAAIAGTIAVFLYRFYMSE
ncbi:UNVERIFIED_CONTAM: hypothetical protein K2H54_017021 [Gekko kuhli]